MNCQEGSGSHIRKWVLSFVVAIMAILMIAIVTPFVWAYMSPYRQFARKTGTYYSQLAGACDLMLQQHSIGTNTFISVPVSDAGLPKTIGLVRGICAATSQKCTRYGK